MGSAQSYEGLEPGDLIEIFRGLFHHWAVYIGHGYIVHLVPVEAPGTSSNSMSVLIEKAMVKKERLQKVVGPDEWKVNNSLDKEYKPRPLDDIIENANDLIGQELSYSVVIKNCEHFATELRYGKAESSQVQNVVETAMRAGPVGMLGLGLVALTGAGATSSSRRNKHKK